MTQRIDVITVEDVSFKWYQWWSNWVDIAMVGYGNQGYLLQMQVSRNNCKRFHLVPLKRFFNYAICGVVDSLTQMKGGKQ